MTIVTSDAVRSSQARSRQTFGVTFDALEPIVATVDSALIVGSSVLGGALYRLATDGATGDLAHFAGLGLVGSLAYALAAHRCELYHLNGILHRRRDFTRIAMCWSWALLAICIVLFLMKSGAEFSRGAFVAFAIIGAVALLGWRSCAKAWLRIAIDRGAVHGRPAVLIGADDELGALRPRDLLDIHGLEEVTRVTLPANGSDDYWRRCESVVDGALARARLGHAVEIVLALSWKNTAQLEFLRERLRITPLPVRLLPDRSVRSLLQHRALKADYFPLIDIQRAPLTATERIVKRGLDIVIAGSALLLLLPTMIAVALAVRLESRGPALFRQRRKGFNGREFVIYKFRTMTVMEDGGAVVQARRIDTRVTRLGRLLRKSSIDELPQLLNVLRGDMSLAGPRPHALAHDDEYSRVIANYAFRHHVKPGMTGWAQVNGCRGGTPRVEDMAKRIELDLWYINNWSLALDVRILLMTAFELIRPRNAY